jgi:hypothetical protein
MCLRQVLPIGAFTLKKVRYRIQPEPIHTHAAPKVDDPEDLLLYQGIVIVEIGLMMKRTGASNIDRLRHPRSSWSARSPGR